VGGVGVNVDYTHGVVGRDPVSKAMVESFLTSYPADTDEEIHARMCRAWRGLSSDPMPITLDEIAHWRAEVAG
jgi:hypothetical protein